MIYNEMFADSSCNQKYPDIFVIFLKTKNYQDINNATYDKLREKLIWDPLVDVQLIKAKFFYKWCFSYKPDTLPRTILLCMKNAGTQWTMDFS